MLISSHCLHCRSAITRERGSVCVNAFCNFTHERRRQQDFRAPQKAHFYISVSWRGDPHAEHCRGRKKKTTKQVYLSTQLQFHFERLRAETPTHWTACCLAAFKENNVWFISSLPIFPLHLGLPFRHLHSDKLRWKAVWLSNGYVAFKNTRPLLFHFDTREVWNSRILFKMGCYWCRAVIVADVFFYFYYSVKLKYVSFPSTLTLKIKEPGKDDFGEKKNTVMQHSSSSGSFCLCVFVCETLVGAPWMSES